MNRVVQSLVAVTFAIAVGGRSGAMAQDFTSPPGAKVFFQNLKNGDTVSNPFVMKFGLSGMDIAPAEILSPAAMQGDLAVNTGHHHLLINAELKYLSLKLRIPSADDKHRHFGKGQTETSLTLPPGEHMLQLVLGDWQHFPHNPPVMSERIKITVK